jgi:hypothetical protein
MSHEMATVQNNSQREILKRQANEREGECTRRGESPEEGGGEGQGQGGMTWSWDSLKKYFVNTVRVEL